MRGISVVTHYTDSMIRIFSHSNPHSVYYVRKIHPQAMHQHNNFPRRQNNNQTNNNFQYQTRRGGNRTYSRVQDHTEMHGGYRHGQNIEVSNRFSVLGN